MNDDYIRIMNEKENLCLNYMQKADDEFYFSNEKHTKEECMYLQKAATLRSEMVNMSVGEEKEHHRKLLQELNRRIAAIVRVLDPELLSRMNTKKNVKSSEGTKEDAASSAAAASAPKASKEDVKDETVSGWYKPAPKHSFAEVAGMDEVKEQLKECIEDAQMDKLKKYMGLKDMSSYFFVGPPGCGKTYIIEAFAHELLDQDYKYLSLVGSDILSRYVGEAEKIITRLFQEAEENAPCIVFIDEIDGVCKNRSLPNLPEYASSITTAFLTGYNKAYASDKPIIFIGATNYPNQVDNAMLDRVELIRIPFPDKDARAHKFRMALDPVFQLGDDLTFEDMADMTDTYNYRDIDRLVSRIKHKELKKVIKIYHDQDKAIEALKSGSYPLTKEMFVKTKDSCLPTPKDSIIKDLDEWEKKFKKGQEEG